MIFKKTEEKSILVKKINHYIMMLDDSSSMHGLRWINLKNSFTIFLNKLASDVRLRENTKITCI